MQKRRVFVDSSVLIRGLLFEITNSALILKMIRKKELTGVINRKVVYEVLDVLKQIKDKDFDGVKNYFTPKKFLESMSVKTYDTEY